MELFGYLLDYCIQTFLCVLIGIAYLDIVLIAYLVGYATAAM